MQSYEEFVYSCVLSDQSFILCVDCICHQSVHVCLYFWIVFGWVFFWKPSLYDIGPKVMEKKIFKNTQRQFSLFSNQLPYEVDLSLYLKFKLKVLLQRIWLYHICLTLTQRIWRRFLKHSTISVFSIFLN